MGYLHIDNLYKNKEILMFKECYALEKIHGTSAHIRFKDGGILYFSGGENHANFVKLFDGAALLNKAIELALDNFTIFGEAYGGSQQGMSHTYGKQLKFIAFDVKIDENWLAVPQAEEIVKNFGLEFVHYELVPTDLLTLDLLCAAPSVQGKRNGIAEDKLREGIVLRPLIEMKKNNGDRIISKHKNEKFQERQNQPKLTQDKLEVMIEANKIADEWVTQMRLSHILGKMSSYSVQDTGDIIKAMIEDISREAKGEIVENKDFRKVISQRTAIMFKDKLKQLNILGGH